MAPLYLRETRLQPAPAPRRSARHGDATCEDWLTALLSSYHAGSRRAGDPASLPLHCHGPPCARGAPVYGITTATDIPIRELSHIAHCTMRSGSPALVASARPGSAYPYPPLIH